MEAPIYVELSPEVLELCGSHFEMEALPGKKVKSNCSTCPITKQCLKDFSLKKMGTMNARNEALNEYVAGMDS